MKNYMVLLRAEGRPEDIAHPADAFEQMVAWANDLAARGILRGVNPLVRKSAKTLRKSSGHLVVDGPFAEGKEAVLGYFIFEAANMDAAVAVAADCPALAWEAVELVEVGDFPQPHLK